MFDHNVFTDMAPRAVMRPICKDKMAPQLTFNAATMCRTLHHSEAPRHMATTTTPSSRQNIKLKKCTHLKQRRTDWWLAQLAAILLLASAHAQPGAVLLVRVTDGRTNQMIILQFKYKFTNTRGKTDDNVSLFTKTLNQEMTIWE